MLGNSPRDLARLLRANANEPWMTIGAQPFAADSARVIDELADAVERATILLDKYALLIYLDVDPHDIAPEHDEIFENAMARVRNRPFDVLKIESEKS